MPQQSKTKQADRPVALITGASRGIGKHVAYQLAGKGYHVCLLARTTGALEEVDDHIHNVIVPDARERVTTLVPFDLRRYNKLTGLGHQILQLHGRLDVLVANAGILGTLSPAAHIDTKDWQKIIDVNVTSNLHLIRSLDSLLQTAPNGHAIFVGSSLVNKTPQAYWGAYTASKAALKALVQSYAAENEKTSLTVSLIEPSATDTDMLNQAFPGGFHSMAHKPEDVAAKIVTLCGSDTKNGIVLSL